MAVPGLGSGFASHARAVQVPRYDTLGHRQLKGGRCSGPQSGLGMFGFACVFASAGAVACGVSTLAWPRKAALAIEVR